MNPRNQAKLRRDIAAVGSAAVAWHGVLLESPAMPLCAWRTPDMDGYGCVVTGVSS
jgi:hypothetical protein